MYIKENFCMVVFRTRSCRTDEVYTTEWDRVVGYGKVPEQYHYVSTDNTDGQDKQGCEKTRESKSGELANKSKITQQDMDGKILENYKKVWGDRWEDYCMQKIKKKINAYEIYKDTSIKTAIEKEIQDVDEDYMYIFSRCYF